MKITFAQAGAAVKEVGSYMVRAACACRASPRGSLQRERARITLTPIHTNTPSLGDTAVSDPTNTLLSANTAVSIPTDIPTQLPTPIAPPIKCLRNACAHGCAANSSSSHNPCSRRSSATRSWSRVPIRTLTFTCNGNAVEIRGHANTITLLGSCSSITVTGNGNRVFWQSGSPGITNRGRDNIILQL